MPKTYESITTKQTLNAVKEERMPFNWSINPYKGCAHGCSFCYARGFQSFAGKGAGDEFQDHISLKINAAEALETQLHKLAAKFKFDLDALGSHLGQIAIGTATDPYQPVEGKARLTREILKVLARYRVPVSITTRSPLIARDIDLLRQMNVESVNISLNTLDAQLLRKLEPGAPLPAGRLETIAALAAEGIPVGMFAAPILPYLTDAPQQLEDLLRASKENGASFVMASPLRLSPDVKGWYYGVLGEHFPHLLRSYDKLFRGAYAEREYRERLMRLMAGLLEKYGLSGSEPDTLSESDTQLEYGLSEREPEARRVYGLSERGSAARRETGLSEREPDARQETGFSERVTFAARESGVSLPLPPRPPEPGSRLAAKLDPGEAYAVEPVPDQMSFPF